MLTEKIDFSSYSKEELVGALESVDDEKYPENAVEIFSLLESKFISERESIDDKYNEENTLLENVFEIAFFPIFFTQGSIKKSQMQEKLLRIRKLVAADET